MLKNLASLAAFFLALAMPANPVRAEELGDVIVRHVNVVDVASLLGPHHICRHCEGKEEGRETGEILQHDFRALGQSWRRG